MTEPRTLAIGYNGAFSSFTLSPLRVRARGGVTRWIYSSLFRYDEDGELVGDLVDRWAVSPDRMTYLLTLRDGVSWHDGHPLTASDVVFTANLLQQEHRAFRNVLMAHGEPAKFAVVNDLTLRIDLAGPQTNFLTYLTPVWGALFLVLPEHIVSVRGEDAFEESPIGTGPFRWGGRVDDTTLRLEAFDDYFDGRPLSDRVDVRFFSDNSERVAAFENGEIDVLVFPGREFSEEDAERAGGRLYSTATNTIMQFALNCRNPLFEAVQVRQGIAAAIDRESLVKAIEGPRAVPAYSPVGSISWAHAPEVEQHPYDPGRARTLLAQAGWLPGDDGVLMRNGSRFEFTIMYPPDTWNYQLGRYAEGIAENLAQVGVIAMPEAVDYWTTLKTAWRDQIFDSFIYYDTFYLEPDLYWSWHSSMPRRPVTPEAPSALPQYGYGVTGFANPRVDALIQEYREAPDQEMRRACVIRAQQILADQAASVWLYNHQWKNAVRNDVAGLSKPGISDGTSDLVVLLRPERLFKKIAN